MSAIVRPLREYIRDEGKVPPESQTGLILFLAEEAIPGFDVRTHEVYSRFIKKRQIKKAFFSVLTKKLVVNEAKRRNPDITPNASNSTKSMLIQKMRRLPLSEEDKAFVVEAEAAIRVSFQEPDVEEEPEFRSTNPRSPHETFNDRLRFVSLFNIQELKAKYLATQSSLDDDGVDLRNSTIGETTTFWEAAVEKFNDPRWTVLTEALPTLHPAFEKEIMIVKGPYTLTADKAKKMILKMRPKIADLNRRYEISGNGAKQRAPDSTDNTNDDTSILSEDSNEGDGNRAGASGKEGRKYNDELAKLRGGDDRADFLGIECPSLLYWFHILDVHELIGFTCAKLSERSSASSHSVPAPNAPKSKKKKKKRKRAASVAPKAKSAKSAKKLRKRKMMKKIDKLSAVMDNLVVESMRKRLARIEQRIDEYLDKNGISTDDEDDECFVPSRRLKKLKDDAAGIESQIAEAERRQGQESSSSEDDDNSGSDSSAHL
eukprot:scaffold6925_cov116-Cylindrotheca_fusiformis.AAC.7